MNHYTYFSDHPLRRTVNRRQLMVADMLAAEDAAMSPLPGKINPVAGAFIHYGGVELADRLVMLKPRSTAQERAKLEASWNASCGVIARSLIFYVWRIIAREMRHGTAAKCAKAFGKDYMSSAPCALIHDICTTGSFDKALKQHGPTTRLGPYIDMLERHYRKGGWGGAFGGKKWADIVVQLQLYIDGKASALLACDRMWTLVHNTASIFNKPHYFEHASTHQLMKVFEPQAASSVFTLGMDYHQGHDDGPHVEAFNEFAALALELIQRSDPTYDPTAKPDEPKISTTEDTSSSVVRFGPVAFTMEADNG